MDSDGKFDRESEPNPKVAYWQERAAFWRDQALRLGYVPEGERDSKPSWDDAPADATHLAQHDDGEWVWFMNCDYDPIPLVSVGGWGYSHCGPGARCSHVIPKGKPNPNWHDTLERRPAQEGHGTEREVGKSEFEQAMRRALDDVEAWIDHPNCRCFVTEIKESPDLVIPKDAAEAMCGYSWVEELSEAGYRIEIDEHGLRGWKE